MYLKNLRCVCKSESNTGEELRELLEQWFLHLFYAPQPQGNVCLMFAFLEKIKPHLHLQFIFLTTTGLTSETGELLTDNHEIVTAIFFIINPLRLL